MDKFRFILETPNANSRQKKRARLVTACDSCRLKKIKCQQPVLNGRCDACRISKIPCLFGDRDRYQAERGVTCTWISPNEAVPEVPVTSSRKRKMTPALYPTTSFIPELLGSTYHSSNEHSRSATPADESVSDDRYFHLEQDAGPSFVPQISVFPQNTPPQENNFNSTSYDQLPLFDPNRPRFPHPYRMRRLGAIFFDQVGAHFPFLDRYDVLHRIEQRTCSVILSNCIAGLAIRFANPSQPDLAAGAPFYDMAKSLVSHGVSVPSVEALHALICITWAEYGSGCDDEFGMYSRMALAMCLDLGLGHEATIQVAATPEVRHRLRLTWWMVVSTADVAASWVTGRPATLDLDQYDTMLPEAIDDLSLLFRNIANLYVLRGKLNNALDAHVENQGDSSLDWDLSNLQTDLQNMSKTLPPTMVFNEGNLLDMHSRQMGHVFVQMHLLMQAVSTLLHRPSLLPSYGLPVPMEGPRADAARNCAKSLANILIIVESVAPQALRDPFMDLPILVACHTFIAESDAHAAASMAPRSAHSTLLAKQWSDTFLGKCKESLVRLSVAWGGAATFENILDHHGGTLADDLHLHASSSIDLFTAPNSSHQWLHPNILDDGASDSSGSFRSSSREISPRISPSTLAPPTCTSFKFNVGGSPLVREVDDSGAELNTRQLSFYPSELSMPGSLVPGQDGGLSYIDEPCALQLIIDNAEVHRLLNVDMWRKDSSAENRQSSYSNMFSPLPWPAGSS